MLDILYKGNDLVVTNSDKKEVYFNLDSKEVFIDGFSVDYPGEYEKSGILLEVKEYQEKLFYSFFIDTKRVLLIVDENFEIKEEILDFFGDIDLLLIPGSKTSCKVYENIEAKIVLPYGEGKDLFLNTLGQHPEEESNYKMKAELPIDATLFVNLIV